MTAAQAFFLPTADGQRYGLYHAPAGQPRSLVLYVHPFAEELNRTRRMAALQARALAQAGHAVLQLDLLGCGDSSGDFGDASWPAWLADLEAGAAWLRERHGAGPRLWLWGLRAGCLLAADAARRLQPACDLLFWQPSFADGAMQLQQFLRLRLASDLLAASGPGESQAAGGAMQLLRQQLEQQQQLEIAGYQLPAGLAAGLAESRLLPPPPAARLVWLEVGTAAPLTPSPLAKRMLDAWRAAGWQAECQAVAGPAFWQSTEIEEAPALLAASVAALAGGPAA